MRLLEALKASEILAAGKRRNTTLSSSAGKGSSRGVWGRIPCPFTRQDKLMAAMVRESRRLVLVFIGQ
jgi:hypothetical protein